MAYPHPYIMDSDGVEGKLDHQTFEDHERLKEMIREFSRYHRFCYHARQFLSCNIDLISDGKTPHPWPPVNLPGNCPE